MIRRLSSVATVLAAASLLAACSSLLPGDEQRADTYRITPPAVSAAAAAPDRTLVIGEPSASAGLATDRIAVWETPERLQYYEGARWVTDAPEMLHSALVEAFRSANALEAVGRRSVALDPDYRLRTRLSDFEAGYEGGAAVPTVRVTVEADLMAEPGRDVVASRRFTREATPASDSVPDVVEAYDQATDAVLEELVRWTVGAMTGGAGA